MNILNFEIGLWNAWWFMLIFLIQMLVIMLVDKTSWKKSHIPMQANRNGYEKNIGKIANGVWFLALIYSFFLPLKLDTYYFYISLVVFIIGLLILIQATYDFITTDSNNVIKKGIYSFSRHPMYLATLIIVISISIVSYSLVFLLLSIIMIFFFHKEALIEERYCLEIYGQDYKEYLKHIPRWIGIRK